jgi:hypothetical protein
MPAADLSRYRPGPAHPRPIADHGRANAAPGYPTGQTANLRRQRVTCSKPACRDRFGRHLVPGWGSHMACAAGARRATLPRGWLFGRPQARVGSKPVSRSLRGGKPPWRGAENARSRAPVLCPGRAGCRPALLVVRDSLARRPHDGRRWQRLRRRSVVLPGQTGMHRAVDRSRGQPGRPSAEQRRDAGFLGLDQLRAGRRRALKRPDGGRPTMEPEPAVGR